MLPLAGQPAASAAAGAWTASWEKVIWKMGHHLPTVDWQRIQRWYPNVEPHVEQTCMLAVRQCNGDWLPAGTKGPRLGFPAQHWKYSVGTTAPGH